LEKLSTKVDKNTWPQVKEILEEDYMIKVWRCDTEGWDNYRQEHDGMAKWEARLSQAEIEIATLRREIRDLEVGKCNHQIKEETGSVNESAIDTRNKRIEIVVKTEQGESTSTKRNPKTSIRPTK
jgi:hypothetical protein